MEKYKPMSRLEKELAGITGVFNGKYIAEINPLLFRTREECQDFLCVLHLYNAEVLDGMTDTSVAKKLLNDIGIKC